MRSSEVPRQGSQLLGRKPTGKEKNLLSGVEAGRALVSRDPLVLSKTHKQIGPREQRCPLKSLSNLVVELSLEPRLLNSWNYMDP